MKNLSTDPVNNPGENQRASAANQAIKPLHGTLVDHRPTRTVRLRHAIAAAVVASIGLLLAILWAGGTI